MNRQLRQLVLFKAWAALRAESSRYYLSVLWWVIDPILSMSVYYLIFGLLLSRGGPDYIAFLLIGIVAWQWLERGSLRSMPTVFSSGQLINTARIPKLYFPLVTITVDTIKFLIVLTLLLIYLWLSGYPPSAAYLALPLVIGVQLLLLAGIGIFLSSIMPFVPDMKYLIEVLFRLGFFGSCVLFPASRIPDPYRDYLYLNPVVGLLDAYRDVLLQGAWPQWYRLGTIVLIAAPLIGLGTLLLKRFDHQYPRILHR